MSDGIGATCGQPFGSGIGAIIVLICSGRDASSCLLIHFGKAVECTANSRLRQAQYVGQLFKVHRARVLSQIALSIKLVQISGSLASFYILDLSENNDRTRVIQSALEEILSRWTLDQERIRRSFWEEHL